MRIFGVDYAFLSCGDVFTKGLVHAAADLGYEYAHADQADPGLPGKIQKFDPDFILVVHGRKFARRWHRQFAGYRTAVWLLDEPYEVDDTSGWSKDFDQVFLNDDASILRHKRATYLPVCYDPHVHHVHFDSITTSRPHAVGFIGGGNGTRDAYLSALASRGLLSYVVGGPWHAQNVNALCRSGNIAPSETAKLYQSTRIILNVFREKHHYNRQQIPATAMNPRIYEALACGALVVSEWRPEIDEVVPELPTFRTTDECLTLVSDLLADPARASRLQAVCSDRLSMHTYATRLHTVVETMQVDSRCAGAVA